MRDRRAEEREHTVPCQLCDGAVETLDLLAHETDDLVEQILRALRPELLGDRRRARDVGHQDGDDTPFAGRNAHGLRMTFPPVKMRPDRASS